MSFAIRSYHPSDLTTLYRICLQTGDNGNDASARFQDPDLLGHFYVAPYAVLEPDLAFVLTRLEEPVGYALATRDTNQFKENTERDWFPPLRARYPLSAEADHSADAEMIRLLHKGMRDETPYPGYPAHLHIDLLPGGQGVGQGRRLIESLAGRLAALDVSGVYLHVGSRNENAIGFYAHVGFQRLQEYPGAIAFGMRL